MSISPVMSPLPGLSSANFSFFPDEIEPQEASSTQELALKDRIKSVVDRLGYKTYSIFNPPFIKSEGLAKKEYATRRKEVFEETPLSYEEARANVFSYTEDNIGTWGPDLEIKNVDLYADPEFRKERVKAYADSLFDGTADFPGERKEEFWLIMTFCKKELQDLYRREPKYLKKYFLHDLWMIRGHNKPILTKHKKEWDQLSPSEKAEKIFGKRRKYEVAAGISTVSACFFLIPFRFALSAIAITATAIYILKKYNK